MATYLLAFANPLKTMLLLIMKPLLNSSFSKLNVNQLFLLTFTYYE